MRLEVLIAPKHTWRAIGAATTQMTMVQASTEARLLFDFTYALACSVIALKSQNSWMSKRGVAARAVAMNSLGLVLKLMFAKLLRATSIDPRANAPSAAPNAGELVALALAARCSTQTICSAFSMAMKLHLTRSITQID